MPTMKAIREKNFVGASAHRFEDAPRPWAGLGEVLVRGHADSVYPTSGNALAGLLMRVTVPGPANLGGKIVLAVH